MKGGTKLPSRLVFHGQGGIGKTSFAAHAPAPFFLLSPGETGLHTLIDSGQLPAIANIEVHDWPSLLDLIEQLTTQDHAYKTLVLDVLDGFEKLANEYVCQVDFNGERGEKGFMGYQRGYKVVASGPWRELLAALDKLRSVKRMGIICLAHTGIGNFQNPAGPDYNRFVPDIFKDAWQLAYAWADIVLFGYHEVVVAKEKGDRKGKGQSGVRIMRTEYDATADAKNRHALPPEIEMGSSGAEAWANLVAAIQEGRKKEVANG